MSETNIFNVPVSIGTEKRSSDCIDGTLTVEQLKNPVIVPDVENKDGAWFCPFLFESGTRNNETAVTSQLLVFDVDDITREVMLKVLNKINELGLEKVIYTTTRHTPERPRYRLILRSDQPIYPEDYRKLLPVVADAFGLPFDASSCKPTQFMFMAMVGEDNKEHFKFKHTPGIPLPIKRFLEFDGSQGEDPDADDYQSTNNNTLHPMQPPDGVPNELWVATIAETVPAKGCSYEDWVQLGQAIWHQTFGSDEGFAIWDKWSQADKESYDKNRETGNSTTHKWKGFEPKEGRKNVTMRSILNKKIGSVRVEALVISKLIEQTADTTELDKLKQHVKEQRYIKQSEIDGPISRAYRDQIKELTDSTITQAQAQRDLQMEQGIQTAEENEFFYDNLVWVAPENKYYDLNTDVFLSITTFNLMYTKRFSPVSRSNDRKYMHDVLTKTEDFKSPRIVQGIRYFPLQKEKIVIEDGVMWINKFNDKNWPSYDDNFGEHFADEDVKHTIERLLYILSDNRPEVAQYMKQYLAHLRQFPGVRITHAYSLVSIIGGVGKSMWETMHGCVLGQHNVGAVNFEILQEQFTEWMGHPRLITFVQELEGGTPNQMTKALAKLKEPITNRQGPIRIKGKDVQVVPFYSSYVVLSNMEHALGDQAASRRFLPIRIERPLIDQHLVPQRLTDLLGEDSVAFFTLLSDLMRDHPERYAAYFDLVDLEGFDRHSISISTSEKNEAENTSIMSKVKQLIHEFIVENQDPSNMNELGVYLPAVIKKLQFEGDIDGDEKFIGTKFMRDQVRNALKILGYTELSSDNSKSRISFGACNRPRSNAVWVKNGHSVKELRDLLAKLPQKSQDD